jgi:hypothetical protein
MSPPHPAEPVMLAPQVALLKDGIERLGGVNALLAHQIGQANQVPIPG